MGEARLSTQLYRWIGENGGWQIGRKVLTPANREATHGLRVLMRCDFGWLHWVDYQDIEEHDTTYREQEKEAEARVQEKMPSLKQLIEIAEKNSPPQAWFDADENLTDTQSRPVVPPEIRQAVEKLGCVVASHSAYGTVEVSAHGYELTMLVVRWVRSLVEQEQEAERAGSTRAD